MPYVDHILGCIREAVIGARLLRGAAAFVVVTVKVISSVPKKRARIWVMAPVTLFGSPRCSRDSYGVLIIGCQFGSPAVRGLPSLSPF